MTGGYPTVVSFYAGDRYYYDAADALRSDCDALGLKHDIREIVPDLGDDWANLCRRKIGFYREMLERHPSGILWTDVDTRLVRRPEATANANYDFGAFLRNFKDLRDFDPVTFSRTFHPGFLHFTGTDNARAFVDHLAQVERSDATHGTDDYFLEEGFRTYPSGMSINLFDADILCRSPEDLTSKSVFIFGASGNVKDFKGQVAQHRAEIFDVNRQKHLLLSYAEGAIKNGKRFEARVFLREAHKVSPQDQGVALRLANIELKTGGYNQAAGAIKKAFGARFTDIAPVSVMVESALGLGEHTRAEANLNRLRDDSPEADAYRSSRRFRIDLDRRAEGLGLRREDRPGLWWMETPYPGNLGDVLNPYIIEKLSGLPPRFVEKGEGILAIGSVIKFAKTGTEVWGTGTPRLTDRLAPDAHYRAVRGPLTRQLVQASGGQCPEIYGDAAMLLPLIYQPKPKERRKLGLIRHVTHLNEPVTLSGDVAELSLYQVGYERIEQFIDDLCACDAIISTSLHGLIIAQAYGIPTRYAQYSQAETTLPGDGTKFADHYLAFDIEQTEPLDLSGIHALSEEDAHLCTERVRRPLRAVDLLRAAPFPVLDTMMSRAKKHDRRERIAPG